MTVSPKALIVDDDPSFCLLLSRHLRKLGVDATARSAGAPGLLFLETNQIDLVCLDLMLPDRSGFAVCEAIRKLPNNSNVPVLVISARVSPDVRARAEQAGGNGYLLKPLRSRDLAQEVRRLLTRQAPPSSSDAPGHARGV